MRSEHAECKTLAAALDGLIQDGWSGAVRVRGAKNAGVIFLDAGRVVHAECGRVRGEFAYWLLIGMPESELELEAGAGTAEYTIARPLELPIPAARPNQPRSPEAAALARAQESDGSLWEHWWERARVPLQTGLGVAAGITIGVLVEGAWGPSPAAAPQPLPREAAAAPHVQSSVPIASEAADAAQADATPAPVGASSAELDRAPESAARPAAALAKAQPVFGAATPAADPEAAIELDELDEQGDERPRVLEARAAEAASEAALSPEIVVRVRIDPQGRVASASVYSPRPGHEEAERAALQAAQGYRFTPALRGGRPVSVWLGLPVRVP